MDDTAAYNPAFQSEFTYNDREYSKKICRLEENEMSPDRTVLSKNIQANKRYK